MSNKKVAVIGFGIFSLLVFLAIIYVPHFEQQVKKYMDNKPKPTNSITPTSTNTQRAGLFELTTKYKGNSVWDYTVAASLPTPCEKATVDVMVAESYPEQVTVKVTHTRINGICAQVIQEFSHSGIFIASEEANIKLVVE